VKLQCVGYDWVFFFIFIITKQIILYKHIYIAGLIKVKMSMRL